MLPTNPLLNATAPAGPHLPVALLRQYAAGTLAPAAQHRVEAHTLACPRCADVLAGLLQTPPATTDQALAPLQQRLRQRVQQQAAPARQPQRARQHRWLAPQLAAAAALLFGLVAGGWWAWQQRQPPLAPTSSPVATGPARRPTDAAPTPAGGYPALRAYLHAGAARFVPAPQAGPRLTGTVLVRLRLGADGKPGQAEALRKLRPDYDAEAMRLLQAGPAWAPASSAGQPAPQVVEVPVVFK